MLARVLAFPAHPLGERVIEFDGARRWAHGNTATPVPALLWIEYDGGFPFSGLGIKTFFKYHPDVRGNCYHSEFPLSENTNINEYVP